MTANDFPLLLPLMILAYGATVLLVLGAFWRNHTAMAALTVLIFLLALGAIITALPLAPRQVTPLLRMDTLSFFYLALFLFGGMAIAIFSWDYFQETGGGREQFYALLLFSVLGMGVLAASSHFASFFLGLEVLSVSLFGLIGFPLGRPPSQEASLKYLVLAGTSSSFLLLGIALVYSEYGTMQFAQLATALEAQRGFAAVTLLGLGLIFVGFAFKLALAPFHTWAPDVYQGAPAPVSALVATGSKAAMFALLLRFAPVFLPTSVGRSAYGGLEALCLLTMFVGNLLALLQRNLKRMLAYSSVAHMGYLLIPLLVGGPVGATALSFYFVSYFITTIAAFGLIAALSHRSVELEDLADYRGLGFRRPALAAALGLTMLSLAGVPLTVGFMAKLTIFAAAARSGLWLLLILGLLNSGISAYYYLQVLVTLYSRPEEQAKWRAVRPASAFTLALLSMALIFFGLFPGLLLRGTQQMAEALRPTPASEATDQPTSRESRSQGMLPAVTRPRFSGHLDSSDGKDKGEIEESHEQTKTIHE